MNATTCSDNFMATRCGIVYSLTIYSVSYFFFIIFNKHKLKIHLTFNYKTEHFFFFFAIWFIFLLDGSCRRCARGVTSLYHIITTRTHRFTKTTNKIQFSIWMRLYFFSRGFLYIILPFQFTISKRCGRNRTIRLRVLQCKFARVLHIRHT